jgi:hypothetical protein
MHLEPVSEPLGSLVLLLVEEILPRAVWIDILLQSIPKSFFALVLVDVRDVCEGIRD